MYFSAEGFELNPSVVENLLSMKVSLLRFIIYKITVWKSIVLTEVPKLVFCRCSADVSFGYGLLQNV